MVKFILQRPIAVSMTFLAIVILGLVASSQLPVSLMPDVVIPKITIQASYPNHSASEVEAVITKALRRQLMQVSHLDDMHCESRNEGCVIQLEFDYGADIDLIFIEVNEKIDRATAYLPNELARPRVIKASATDLPVFYLNITSKNDKNKSTSQKLYTSVSKEFIELSDFCNQVIRKRLEQQQEVAMVDVSGLVFSELLIIPDLSKLESLGLTISNLENALSKNNISLGNLQIRDGQYQYSIRFASTLQNKEDIEEAYIKVDDCLLQLKDVAKVVYHPIKRQGLVTSNGKDAITMAVIKQNDAQMADLRDRLDKLIQYFKRDYPHIAFEITRNQTQLLDYTISNLKQSLLLGGLLAFCVMFLFLNDYKSPLLIGLTIPISLVISFLFFYLLNISINIISLSGLILGVGMMIDNSIIVIDNITQHIERNKRSEISYLKLLNVSCVNGTNELFRPLLSSVLTTCAVFVPLVFIKGLSGALFYDQAMAIAIGLMTSLVVSLTLLPVYYYLLYKRSLKQRKIIKSSLSIDYSNLYKQGFRWVLKHQKTVCILVLIMLVATPVLYYQLEKTKFPTISKDDSLLQIDWNENITIVENRSRIEQVLSEVDTLLLHYTNLVGNQQFLLDHSSDLTSAEGIVYLKVASPSALDSMEEKIRQTLKQLYPKAIYSFSDADNVFDLMFSDDEPMLVAKLRATRDLGENANNKLQQIVSQSNELTLGYNLNPIPWEDVVVLKVSPIKLAAYHISLSSIIKQLKTAFSENELFHITSGTQQIIPVVIGGEMRSINEIIKTLKVNNREGELISIASLLSEENERSLKTIISGKEGMYYPMHFETSSKSAKHYLSTIRELVRNDSDYEVDFGGRLFSTQKLMKQLIVIFSISLLLLYFILAAQFESLTLPLIVLVEVPIDVFGAFVMLKIFGESLNIMALIGIIVMCGIIINDSILKIDTINQLRKQDYGILHAIAEAGHRRLKPILMTSITTILALLPFLFIKGMGGELQRPLALAVIGGMTIGTLVSLYIVPLLYYWLNKVKKRTL